MQRLGSLTELRTYISALRLQGKTIGFVPTMGYLHEGHLSLMRLARQQSAAVVASIFVNPSQFNNPEDFAKYHINIEGDCELLSKCGVDAVYIPTVSDIYPGGVSAISTWVEETSLAAVHEGQFRPGHFRGVTTVVSILFNQVQPDFAVFGEKDLQQLRVIEKMVRDLSIPVKVLPGPLVREPDGLAMSSRNVRLSAEGRRASLKISQGLFKAVATFSEGSRSSAQLLESVRQELRDSPLVQEEYIRLVHGATLQERATAEAGSRIIVAAFVEGVRLIDNIAL